jgi:hypothetical protein
MLAIGTNALCGSRKQAVEAVKQRVAVGRSIGGKVGGDVAVRSRPVVDHDGLPEPLAERRADRTRDDVCRSAGREGNNQADGAVRIGLRLRHNARGHDAQHRDGKAKQSCHGLPRVARAHRRSRARSIKSCARACAVRP